MLLYDSRPSRNCYKVGLLLAHRGIRYERQKLSVSDRSNRPAVLGGLNPALQVPTIVLDDGRALAESNAILWYFGDGTRYVPENRYERAQVLQWQFFEQYNHELHVAVARFWLNYKGGEIDRIALAAHQKAGYRGLDAMEKHLADREFFVGSRYSLADISLHAHTHVEKGGDSDLSRYPTICAWLARIAAQPGHVTIEA